MHFSAKFYLDYPVFIGHTGGKHGRYFRAGYRTQAIVSESLERLEATRVVIAHRLSTIISADRIFVVDNGQIIQSGRYEELITQPGLFAELAKRQIA